MEWTTVIITNVVQPSKTAFGVREDNGEQVFVPPAVSKTMGLEVSDIVLAKLVPNKETSAPSKHNVPWFAPLMARTAGEIIDADEVYDALDEFEHPVTAEEADLPMVSLQQAYQQGRIVKLIVMPSPKEERVIMWAADMDRV